MSLSLFLFYIINNSFYFSDYLSLYVSSISIYLCVCLYLSHCSNYTIFILHHSLSPSHSLSMSPFSIIFCLSFSSFSFYIFRSFSLSPLAHLNVSSLSLSLVLFAPLYFSLIFLLSLLLHNSIPLSPSLLSLFVSFPHCNFYLSLSLFLPVSLPPP